MSSAMKNALKDLNSAASQEKTTAPLTEKEEGIIKKLFEDYGVSIESTTNDTNSDDGVLYEEYVVMIHNPDRKAYDRLMKALDKLEDDYDIGYWNDYRSDSGDVRDDIHFFHYPEEDLNSALKLPDAYADIYDKVKDLVSNQMENTIDQFMDSIPVQSISQSVKEYSADWCSDTWSAADQDKVEKAKDQIIETVVDNMFANLPEDIKSSRTNANRKLNSAGFIKIGNKAIPTDVSNMGYADYETVQREGKRLEEEDSLKKENEAFAEKGKAVHQAYEDAIAEKIGAPAGDLIDAAFEVLVPSSGRADTQAGEIIRALSRLRYRYYNDGDYFYTGYGLETAGSDAAWLYDNVPASQKLLDDAALNEWTSTHYEEMLDDLSQVVLDYIDEHAEVFGQEPTADSRQYSSYRLSEWEDESYSEEFEVDVSGDYIDQCIENGWLDWDEVYYFLEGCIEETDRGRINQWARDGFTITDINSEEYDRLERELYKWMEEWLEEIMMEHADDEEEEEEDWE